ncbi:MAG: hypothetical protein IJ328_06120 [Muribaculaceae bacterium]|nr:hypothetical protein [Muribaculaceae bacterium]
MIKDIKEILGIIIVIIVTPIVIILSIPMYITGNYKYYNHDYWADNFRNVVEYFDNDNTLTDIQSKIILEILVRGGWALNSDGLHVDRRSARIHAKIEHKYKLSLVGKDPTEPKYFYECFKKELLKYPNIETLYEEYSNKKRTN